MLILFKYSHIALNKNKFLDIVILYNGSKVVNVIIKDMNRVAIHSVIALVQIAYLINIFPRVTKITILK